MPKNRQYYRKTKYPDKVTKPKRLVFVRIFLFCSVGIKIQYFPTAPLINIFTLRNPLKDCTFSKAHCDISYLYWLLLSCPDHLP